VVAEATPITSCDEVKVAKSKSRYSQDSCPTHEPMVADRRTRVSGTLAMRQVNGQRTADAAAACPCSS